MQKLPLNTVLIANRGEIAVRIIKTLRELELRSAIVCHDLDAGAPAVSMADMAIAVSGRTPVSAYLDTAQIIAAAREANVGRFTQAMDSCQRMRSSRGRWSSLGSPSSGPLLRASN